MNLAVREHEALLKAQSRVWHILYNFMNSMSLKCAIHLGIPDISHKHGNPMTLSELVTALPIHPTKTQYVHRLMRILVHSGFFEQQKLAHKRRQDLEEGFVVTNACQLILKDNPLGATPFLLATRDPMLTEPGHHLHLWFQRDDPTPFSTAHGSTLWDLCSREPRLNNYFNEAMASDFRLASCVLIDKHKGIFEGLTSLVNVDVGGGTGTMAKALAKAYPELSCTVLDLPHVVADLENNRNLKFVEGDMFKAVSPADAIMMKKYKEWILRTMVETWNSFYKKFTALWDEQKDGPGEAYLPAICYNSKRQKLTQEKFMRELFHGTLGFGAAKMIRRIVGVVHVEDFEPIKDASKRANCERKALETAKILLKDRRKFQSIAEVVSVIQEKKS